ncbi:hypothetical protein HJ01_03241 [Flavobacterium frigoris PS1]|uniref:Uncharacterized protein n=1 Tax=Flavobacterium frigoris (strain PS1) TaxID=1086011 RepID=H7FVL6_FLAFP|nr:hypothetical protein HJ01_03241 [Flavobacterium frigoris PS1]
MLEYLYLFHDELLSEYNLDIYNDRVRLLFEDIYSCVLLETKPNLSFLLVYYFPFIKISKLLYIAYFF